MNFDFLSSDQTLFSNPDALDPDFIPKLLPHREEQQNYIAVAIKPLFHDRSGKAILVTGTPGVGKTAATKRVLKDLDEVESDKKIGQVFINCWKSNTTYKVICEVSKQLGYPFTQNLKTHEIMERISERIEKYAGVVFAFDEVDKADDYDFLYFILEEFPHKSLVMITNEKRWGSELDDRIRSRLIPETIEFKQYTPKEVFDILSERKKYAFYQDTWDEDAFEQLAEKAGEYKDIRVGIKLLKVAGEIAETDSSKKVLHKHVAEAIARIDEFKIKSSADLTDEEKHVLSICQQNDGKPMTQLFEAYTLSGGIKSVKTFKRKLKRLENKKLIVLEYGVLGLKGRSTLVRYIGAKKKEKYPKEQHKKEISPEKSLDEF
jgi:archaeal cell division control protein 6